MPGQPLPQIPISLGPLISSGSTADIHIGYYNGSGRMCAIKTAKPGFEKILIQEAKILQLIRDHSDCCGTTRINEYIAETKQLVMDIVEGPTIAEVIASYYRPVPEAFAINIIKQILETLSKLHDMGISHGDIKPDNVIVSNGIVTLLDFGTSKSIQDTIVSDLYGCTSFQPPEVLYADTPPSSPQGDIWACGILLFYMLTTRLPCSAIDALKGAYRSRSNINTLLLSLGSVSKSSRHLIRRMLSPDPKKRGTARKLLGRGIFKAKQYAYGAPAALSESFEMI